MFLRILAILGAIAAAIMFWMIGNTKEELTANLQRTESTLQRTESNLRTLEEERDALQTEIAEIEETLQESEANSQQLQNQLAQVRQELEAANAAISARDQEAERLRAEAANIRRQLLDERTRAAEAQETLGTEEGAQMRATIEALERQLIETENQLQTLGATPAAAETETPEKPRREIIRGEVVEVASDSGYILLNIGANAGVRQDSSVMIRRGPQYIGRAVVAEVHEDSAIAEVRSDAKKVLPGDRALTLN